MKQHLAAIRMLFDWLVTGQIVPFNPAASVRGPKHVVRKGKTPVLSAIEAKELIESIPTDTVVGLRDRAIMGVMLYSFARVSAVCGLKVADFFSQGRRAWFRLHEKGGKYHEVPAHHLAEEYVDAYLDAAGIREERKSPPFRSSRGKTGLLSPRKLRSEDVFRIIRRRATSCGFSTAAYSFSRGKGVRTNILILGWRPGLGEGGEWDGNDGSSIRARCITSWRGGTGAGK